MEQWEGVLPLQNIFLFFVKNTTGRRDGVTEGSPVVLPVHSRRHPNLDLS